MNEFMWKCPYCPAEKGWNAPSLSHCGDCGEKQPPAVILQDAPDWMGQQSQKAAKRGKQTSRGEKQATKKQPEELELEERFNDYWIACETGHALIRQHRGIVKYIGKKGKPVYTNHKFDFALPSHNLAIEIQGGIFNRGRHVRPIGYTEDRAKIRKATLQGWTVWEFTTIDMNKKNLHNVVNEILAKIAQIEAGLEKRIAA